jgi:hypothetical protein
MKTPTTILAGCCLLGGMWAMASEKPQSEASPDLSVLNERVKVLEERVSELENRLAATPRTREVPESPFPSLRRGSQIPKGWVPREFNGVPYYVIPIRHDPNGTHPGR